MNPTILNKISSYFATPLKGQDTHARTKSPKLRPLEKDTVSFSANANIENISRRIHKVGLQKEVSFKKICSNIFGNWPYKTRIKSPDSVAHKIGNKGAAEKLSFPQSVKIITDQAGAKVITDGSEEATNEIVKNIIKEIKADNLTITSIRNYHGSGISPYLSKDNINLLKESQKSTPITILEGKEAEKFNGYTSGHITCITKKGLNVEFQIKGKEVDLVDKSTHITHDLSINKSSVKTIDSTHKRKLLAPLVSAYSSLSPKKLEEYNKYLHKCYLTARENEIYSKKSSLPALPKGVPSNLSIENVAELAKRFKHT